MAKAFGDVDKTDWHNEVVPIVEPVIEDMVSSYLEKMDVDGKDAYAEDKRRENTLVGCIEALEKSLTLSSGYTASELHERLTTVLSLMLKISAVRLRGIELTTFTSMEALFEKIDSGAASKLEEKDVQSLADLISKLFFQHDANAYMESVRRARAQAMVAFANVHSPLFHKAIMKAEVLEAEIAKEPDSGVKELLQKAHGR